MMKWVIRVPRKEDKNNKNKSVKKYHSQIDIDPVPYIGGIANNMKNLSIDHVIFIGALLGEKETFV